MVMREKGLVHNDFNGRQVLVERTNITPKPAGGKTGGRPQPNHTYTKKRSAGKVTKSMVGQVLCGVGAGELLDGRKTTSLV